MDQMVPGIFTDFLDKGLEADRTYTYRVMACFLIGPHFSDFSNEATATTLPGSSPPQASPPLPQPVTPDPIPPATGEQIVIRLYIGKTGYYINNTSKSMDVAPLIMEGRTLLPVRYIAEAIGAGVGWEAAAQKATITMGNQLIELWLGNNTARVNGQPKPIDSLNPNVFPVTLPPGRTMLPLRFIAESLGCGVEWDGELRMVTVTYTGT